jgi:hypothetical protein
MKRLIAAVLAGLAVLATPVFADDRSEQSAAFANDHNFVAPPQ